MKTNGKASKHAYIIDALRRDIMGGVFLPGSRLPRQGELAQRFQVGNGTITHVIQQLAREGFLTARPRVGTVVCERLPHLTNIVIALSAANAPGGHWSKYETALVNATRLLCRDVNRPMRLLEGLDDPLGPSRRELTDLVRTHQVAGVLFATSPHHFIGTPVLEEPGVARVAVMSPTVLIAGVDTMIAANVRFLERALDHLAARGRHRIAILGNPAALAVDDLELRRQLAARDMVCRPAWNLVLSLEIPETARPVTRLLMQSGAADRPDGLIIANDNLVDDAIAGLIDEGVAVPQDLDVVAHCNFPWPPAKALPVMRLGVDVRAVLHLGIELIDRRCRGETLPVAVAVPAVFEGHVAAPSLPIEFRSVARS